MPFIADCVTSNRHNARAFQLILALLMALCALLIAPTSGLGQVEVEILPGDAAAISADSGVLLPVYLNNYQDTIFAFELWFRLDRPNVASPQISIDTTKTLIAGWDYLDVRPVDSNGLDIKVTALCDAIPPVTRRGFAPQQGDDPLFRLKLDVPAEPDPFTEEVLIRPKPVLEHFGLSTPDARSIGIDSYPALDTSYWDCVVSDGDSCLEWMEVPGPDADSIHIQVIDIFYVDTTVVIFGEGRLTLVPEVCGDIDGSRDSLVSIADLTRMIDFLFISLEPFQPIRLGNTDGSADDQVTLADLTALVDHLFVTLQPLDCDL
ncbi:hypothetical protein GF377_05705 [candidate division GN15 bacterium]|nr:hypothetical protein [candidate division GN15 bacterium]